MNNNHIKPALLRTIVLLGFAIPLIISGTYLYGHLFTGSEVPPVSADSNDQNLADSTETEDKSALTEPEDAAPNDQNGPLENASTEVENTSTQETSTEDAGNTTIEENSASPQEAAESAAESTTAEKNAVIFTKPYTAAQINLLKTTDQTLYFSAQSFKISNDDKALLDSFIEIALTYPEEMIAIEGHANGYPNFENSILEQTLSEDRMKAVKKYLEEKGVESKVIMTFNCGSSQPASLDETTQQLNDRVEIYFTDYNARGIRDK